MYILFEGLDLSGKSTLCRVLKSALGWKMRHNTLLAPGANLSYQAASEAHRKNTGTVPEVGAEFLRALEFELASFQTDTEPCIQDSTILLRSITYHTALGNHALAGRFLALAPRHPKPALAFLCRASVEARLRRLEGRVSRRNDNPEDFLVRDNPEVFALMDATLAEMAVTLFGAETIDTSNLEDAEARAALIKYLKERLERSAADFGICANQTP